MKCLANILINGIYNDPDLYNVVNSEDDLIDEVPTLIVGWDRVKSMYESVNILDWQIDENTYWTFGKRERRDRLEEDAVRFRNMSMKHLIKSVKYEYFNILTASKDEKKEFLSNLKSVGKKFVYIENNMLYIYDKQEDVVYGLSLMDIEYEGGNPNKILAILHKNENVEFVKDSNDIPYSVKILLKNNRYIIPYLYSE